MMKVVVSIDPLNGEAKNVLQAWGKVVGVQIMELFEGLFPQYPSPLFH